VILGKLSQDHNPADVLSGHGMLPSQSRKTDKQPMWPDQTEATRRAILARKSPNKLRDATLVSVLAYAGLRPGEALGLKWENVGTDSLRIAQVVSGGKLKPATKTDERRTVPKLIRPLMDDLAELREASKATAAKALIFPGEHEKCWTVTAYGNWRGRVWQDCAPESRVPYDLRHGYSLLLAHEGVPIADAAKRMGHKPATHLKDYESFLDELREQPSEPMLDVVLKARNGKRP
jgi:integrase